MLWRDLDSLQEVADIKPVAIARQADGESSQAPSLVTNPELFLQELVEGPREPEDCNEED